jgi:hypothetical protein
MSRRDDNEREDEPLDPRALREWIARHRRRLCDYIDAEGEVDDPNPQHAWSFPPHVIVWSINNGWAINGATPTDYVVGNDTLGSARDAARYFVRHFRERARRLEAARSGRVSEDSQALTRWASALMMSVRDDAGWPEELPGNEPPGARRAEALLNGPLFDTAAAAELASTVRIVHRRKAAPGGEHHGIYFYLDVSRHTLRLFDALAKRIVDIDAYFAPLVVHRVQYAMVYFGINFGNAAQEIEVEKQADDMRVRNPELSRRIDEYGAKDGDLLPIHFVDNANQPFTAHPCLVREPGKAYKAEDSYFNCRDQKFHKQMERSTLVSMRLIAASIDPDVVTEARRAFARRV